MELLITSLSLKGQKVHLEHSSREYVPSKLGRNCDSPSITKYTSTNTRN